MNKEIFSKNLCKQRNIKNYSRKDLSDLLNVSVATIGNWENLKREPSLDMLVKISNILKVSLDELLETEYYSNAASKNLIEDNKENIIINKLDIIDNKIDDLKDNNITAIYNSLNEEGQEKLMEQAELLQLSGKYKKHNQSVLVEEKEII